MIDLTRPSENVIPKFYLALILKVIEKFITSINFHNNSDRENVFKTLTGKIKQTLKSKEKEKEME